MKPMSEEKIELLKLIFPIGSTYITQTNTDPNSILGFGRWERVKGKVLVGLDEDDPDFNNIWQESGSKYIQDHIHIIEGSCGNVYFATGGEGVWLNQPAKQGDYKEHAIQMTDKAGNIIPTGNAGNIQPSKVVGYMWIRTA